MRLIRQLLVRSLPVLACFLLPLTCKAKLAVEVEAISGPVPQYGIFELTFRHENDYERPFFDVSITLKLTSPSGDIYEIPGFHYGSSSGPRIEVRKSGGGHGEGRKVIYHFDRHDLWKARFAPMEEGVWRYGWEFTNHRGERVSGKGKFACARGSSRGFLRVCPRDPFKFVFGDGSLFIGVGMQECWGDGSGTGSALADMSMEGPFRPDRPAAWGKLPDKGPLAPGPSMNPQNGDVYFRTFADCGFNLFRFSQSNCSFPLYADLDNYLVQEAVMSDEILIHARKYGFSIVYGLFGYQDAAARNPEDRETMEKVKRFIAYSVARWGAYVDIWEFLNEQKAEADWYRELAPFLRAADPYEHPITTSWERPELEGIEINAPHWYQWLDGTNRRKNREIALDTDRITAEKAQEWKKHGKPVIVGEAGNYTDPKKREKGELLSEVGGVWDPESALRMRIRNWTGLFNSISFIYWVTSYAKDGHFMNIWIGPRERQYVRAMRDFGSFLDKGVEPFEVSHSKPLEVRAYGLASDSVTAVYFHHFATHDEVLRGLEVTVPVPAADQAYWYSPADAAIVGRVSIKGGEIDLAVPPFREDLALLITAKGPPDIDRDGMPNDIDQDDDNDGVADADDAFMLDPSEWADPDRDDIGNNLDADDDGDGIPDDNNANGVPDFEELDMDSDGLPRHGAVPWDPFPRQ